MIKKIFFTSFLLALIILRFSGVVYSQGTINTSGTSNTNGTLNTATSPDTVSLTNPLGEGVTVYTVISRVITAVLGIVGSLALVMFIYGGFTWMLAAGNNEKIKKGKDILVWSAIGLVVIFSSYAVVKYLITTIGSS